jgi:CBS domain-containing protein
MKKVGELIRRPPITAYPSDTLMDVIEKMARYEVGALIVVNPSEGGKPVAVISERDVVKALAMKMPLSTPVEAFMSTRLIYHTVRRRRD